MNKKILAIDHTVFRTGLELEATVTYKLFQELDKYFDILHVLYIDKAADVTWFNNKKGYKIVPVRYYGRNALQRMGVIAYMYLHNIYMILKEKPRLVWLPVTSSYINFFVFIYRIVCYRCKVYVQLFTPSVDKSKFKRKVLDYMMSLNLKAFKYIGAGKYGNPNCIKYRIPRRKVLEVEVGMPDYGYKERDFKDLKLVYIGSINYRNVWQAVEGFDLFVRKHPECNCTFDIIGAGNPEETGKLMNTINNAKYCNRIKYHGRLSVSEVKSVFDKCNIGVAYVPICDHMRNSSTKTIEYALCGMPIIATANSVRSKLVTEDIGVLCNDDPDSFADALSRLKDNIALGRYSSQAIREKYDSYSIEKVMKTKYVPLIDNLL